MGHTPHRGFDAVDGAVAGGFGCIVAGVAIRYDYALALIVFGMGLLLIGAVAMWRNA
jgi:hypothetical protein